MRRLILGLAMASVAFAPMVVQADDQQIASHIQQKLYEANQTGRLKNFDLDLQVSDGVVWFKGQVISKEQERFVLTTAQKAKDLGVVKIIDEISVVPAAQAAGNSDAQIAETIQQSLRQANQDGLLKDFGLDLNVVNGVVELTGHVASEAQKQLVLNSARQAGNVKEVHTSIDVRSASTPQPAEMVSDDQIAEAIEETLRQANNDGQLKDFGLDMKVVQGVVWFTGFVSSQAQKELVLESAKQLGEIKVIDEITIKAAETVAQTPAPRPLAIAQNVLTQATNAEPIGTGSQTPPAPYYVEAPVQQAADQVVLPPQRIASRPMPAYQMPLAAGPAVNVAQAMPQANLSAPAYTPVSARRANAQYDHPQMPNNAWPSYAPHPNYGALTYPKQYSPSAWPYIGPFYPYPQVPLGWRKVTMEWDDGWWFLDFHDH